LAVAELCDNNIAAAKAALAEVKGADADYLRAIIANREGNTAEEYIMLRLRLKEGLILDELLSLYGEEVVKPIKEKAPLLAKQGLVNYDEKTISLTKKGFLLSNAVISQFL
jgi:coproporphyrinogen III oxidase-like Fe-S oxidoreductase